MLWLLIRVDIYALEQNLISRIYYGISSYLDGEFVLAASKKMFYVRQENMPSSLVQRYIYTKTLMTSYRLLQIMIIASCVCETWYASQHAYCIQCVAMQDDIHTYIQLTSGVNNNVRVKEFCISM